MRLILPVLFLLTSTLFAQELIGTYVTYEFYYFKNDVEIKKEVKFKVVDLNHYGEYKIEIQVDREETHEYAIYEGDILGGAWTDYLLDDCKDAGGAYKHVKIMTNTIVSACNVSDKKIENYELEFASKYKPYTDVSFLLGLSTKQSFDRFWFHSDVPLFGIAKMTGRNNVMAKVIDYGFENSSFKPIERPSGASAFTVDMDHCVCLKGESIDIGGLCDNFCLDTNDPVATLHGTVTPGLDVLLEPSFGTNFEGIGNLDGWCNNILPNTTSANPTCVLELEDPKGNISQAPLTIQIGTNNFTANMTNISPLTIYIAKVRELESGSVTGSFQLQTINPELDVPIYGPLPTIPLHQYACLIRGQGAASNGHGSQFANALKTHFYYNDRLEASPVPIGNNSFTCHDKNEFPGNDSFEYPRLFLREQELRLWNRADIRFQDNGQAYNIVDAADGSPDINSQIRRNLEALGKTVPSNFTVYTSFRWPTDISNRADPPIQGMIMVPWINPRTQRGFCPVQEDYDNGDAVFQVIKELEGNIDTEAVYLGVKMQPPFFDADANPQEIPDDVILITESQLRKIWFYINNGTKIMADAQTATSRTIRFYWPPVENGDPLTQTTSQEEFIIRASNEIGGDVVSLTELNTVIQPSDKRFGCVPRSAGGYSPIITPTPTPMPTVTPTPPPWPIVTPTAIPRI